MPDQQHPSIGQVRWHDQGEAGFGTGLAGVALGDRHLGRDAGAATDVALRAEVLSYSRSRGLFAGVSLAGASLRPDSDANEELYGKGIEAHDIVFGHGAKIPKAAQRMISYLDRRSPKNTSDPRSLRED